MADTKISGLTALTGANTASGDLLTIVDISDTTMAASGTNKKITLTELQGAPVSAGTANGVLYLNGSKVATSGTALVFDGTTLTQTVADAATSTKFAGATGKLRLRPYADATYGAIFDSTNAAENAYLPISLFASNIYNSVDTASIWRVSNTEAMRLTSTGLGIGTSSPQGQLSLGSAASGQKGVTLDWTGAGGPYIVASFTADRSTGEVRNYAYTNFYQTWYTNNSEKMRLDSSGNLGLGVTPSSWGSGFKAFEVGKVGSGFFSVSNTSLQITNNYYYNGTNYVYANNGAAARYHLVDGTHLWFNAPSGTAGNAITFTQAMTLDTTSALLVGTTSSVDSIFKVQVNTGASSVRGLGVNDAGGYGVYLTYDKTGRYGADAAAIRNIANSPLAFETNNTERARIDSSGNLLVGKTSASPTTVGVEARSSGFIASTLAASTSAADTLEVYSTGASAFRFYVTMDGKINCTNTTIAAISDQRLKENVRDIDAGLDKILALKPRTFDWKEGKGKNIKNDRGWIAQEFEQVFPDMIHTWKDEPPEGEEPYKSVSADLIPVLVKAIQELKAEFDAYKASHP